MSVKPVPDSLPRPSLHHVIEGIEEVVFVPENAPMLKIYLKAFERKERAVNVQVTMERMSA